MSSFVGVRMTEYRLLGGPMDGLRVTFGDKPTPKHIEWRLTGREVDFPFAVYALNRKTGQFRYDGSYVESVGVGFVSIAEPVVFLERKTTKGKIDCWTVWKVAN